MAPIAATVALLLCLSCATLAHGAAYGELGQVGGFGDGSGQFSYPTDLAVDPTDNSVYVLDEPHGEQRGAGPASFRIQKFDASLGQPVATVEVLTPSEQVVDDIAVDPELQRLYVLKATEVEYAGSKYYAASEIIEYSTVVKTPGELEKIGVFYKFEPVPQFGPLPKGTVLQPHGLTVQSHTNAVLVLGNDKSGNPVIQQFDVSGPELSGVPGETFKDTEHKLTQSGTEATGIAAGPEGNIYATTALAAGSGRGVVKLLPQAPNSFANPAIEQVELDSSVSGGLTGGFETFGKRDAGTQVAASPEGLIYATQVTEEQLPGSFTQEGNYQIRGMNENGIKHVVFGGGAGAPSPTCRISSAANAIGAGSKGVVYALDEGENSQNEHGEPAPSKYGFRLVEFGPEGSGCPTPSAFFTITVKGKATVNALRGQEVDFEVEGKGLNGEEPEEIMWDLDGSGKYATISKASGGNPASLKASDTYLIPGRYTIGLKIVLKGNGNFGNPPPVTGTLVVEAPPPTAIFEIFPAANLGASLHPGQEIKPGEEVTFNAKESFDLTGGPKGEETTELESYTWTFGDGKTETKLHSHEYSRSFSNTSAEPRAETVTLTVANTDGGLLQQSQPLRETIMVQGTPAVQGGPSKEAPKEPIKEAPSPKSPVTAPLPPSKKPLTRAQKLVRALKACKKDRSKKVRKACERTAHKLYGPKPKKTKKK